MPELKGSKLINILTAITRPEWRLLGQFIDSGVGGPIGKTAIFYKYLSGYYPDFDAIRKEQVFKALFPGEGYEDKKLRYAMTDFYRQTCSFLSFLSLKDNAGAADLMLQETLAKRGADKAYLSHYKEDVGHGKSELPYSAEYFYNRHRESFIHLNHYLPRQQRTGLNPVGDAAGFLDIFYIAKKLQLLCEIINAGNVMSVNYDFFLRDQIVNELKNGAFADVPVIGIYFRILMTLTEPDDEMHFDVLRKLLELKSGGFEKSEQRDMYQYMMNYCIRKINLGNTNYVKVLFEIYQLVLERKIIYNGNLISQWDFKNIVAIGIRAENHNWVYNFIENKKSDLAQNERENAYTYNLAYYYFGTGNFHKAITLLQQVEFTDLYYQLDARAILLKCYYEMDEEETLLYHIAAFRIFLSRNNLVSEYQRTTYRNLIKFANKLVRINSDKKKLDLLLNEINKVKQVADIGWLKRKINEKGI